MKTKSEECEKLKDELERALKSKTQEASSTRNNVDDTQSRITAYENEIVNLKARIKGLESLIEEQIEEQSKQAG